METFIMLTRLTPGRLQSPASYEQIEREVTERIRAECPSLAWVASYAILGPYDYLDVFRAPNVEVAIKASAIIRTFGHAYTEVWPAVEWSGFKELVRDIPTVTGPWRAAR